MPVNVINVTKEEKLLKNLEKLQKKQSEANAELQKNYSSKNDKLYSVLSVAIDKMEMKLAKTLVKGNKAIVKDFTNNTTKNIDHAFGKKAKEIGDVLDKHKDKLNKSKDVFEELEKKRSEKWEESVGYFKESVTDVFSEVKNSFRSMFGSVFGPIYDNLVSPLIGIGKTLLTFGKATFGLIGGMFGNKSEKHQEKTVGILSWIKQFYIDERKRDLRGEVGEDKSFSWLIGLGLGMAALGSIVGGLVRRFTMFFEIFRLQHFLPIQRVISFFAIIGGVVGGWIDDAIKSVAKIPLIGRFIASVLNHFMNFFPAVAKGFRLLGWPLTILLGAIDFIRGFMKTEGNILSKIEGGVNKAIMAFMNLPVKILGWVIDKIAGVFGKEIEGGSGKAINKFIQSKIKSFFDLFRWIFDKINDVFNIKIIKKFFTDNSISDQGSNNNVGTSGISGTSDQGSPANSLTEKILSYKLPSGTSGQDSKNIVGAGTVLSDIPGGTGKWGDPLGPDKRITSEFGLREHPIYGRMINHKGTDMAGPMPGMFGKEVMSSRDGVVSNASFLKGYGNVVYVDHADGYQSRYAHLQSFNVKKGDKVTTGMKIGGMGNTGVGTGPHLHYEIRKDGKPINPLSARNGAMITSQASELGIPAEVHPNEAILPLTDSVLNNLGEKMGKHISLTSDTLSGFDSQDSRRKQKQYQDQISVNKRLSDSINKYMTDIKAQMKDSNSGIGKALNMIVNSNMGSQRQSNNIPDQIENALLVLTNTTWGVA